MRRCLRPATGALAAVTVAAGLLSGCAAAKQPRSAEAAALPPAVSPGTPGSRSHPYLFNQEHRDDLWWWNGTWRPQTLPSGAYLRIQLPGGPVRWAQYNGADCRPTGTAGGEKDKRAKVTPAGTSQRSNPDRLRGFDNLQNFDYRTSGSGLAAICLRPTPDITNPENIGLPATHPVTYVLTILVRGSRADVTPPRQAAG